MMEKLKKDCTFRQELEDKGANGYPRRELCYIRAYHDGSQWWSTVFPIDWHWKTEELIREADALYIAFQKTFPDLKAVRGYVEHDGERLSDPTEGCAYLELEHGMYMFRMITRKGDYNLYLHVLSKAALIETAPEE